jgi:hypothetical protein
VRCDPTQLQLRHLHRHRYARSFTGVAQTAARTRSLYASFKGYYFHIQFLK